MNALFSFDSDKALNAILWVAEMVKDPTFHRISKVIYFADKLHLERYGRLICGDSYCAMKHGPVPSAIYDMLKAVRGDGSSEYQAEAQRAFEVQGRMTVKPLRKADAEVLSESDIECLNESIQTYGRMSFDELTKVSHDEAWNSADENDLIDIEQIIATLPDGKALLQHLQRI